MPSTDRLFLGIDGGGTRTRAVIVNEQGRILGSGEGGASNYDDVGADGAAQSISAAVNAARAGALLDETPFTAAFLGMAGVVSEKDRLVIRTIARDLNLAPDPFIGIDHDCRIALAGGLSGRSGIVQIAGTGSATYGRTATGKSHRAGGWGYLLGDEGGSYWLGLQAMIAAVRMYDGRDPFTSLAERVQVALGLADLEDIMHCLYVNSLSRAEVAALAPPVVEAAADGDRKAQALIEQGCHDLAECVRAVAQALEMDQMEVEVALIGGLFTAGDIFRRPFTKAVHRVLPKCKLAAAELPPVLGACILALASVGIEAVVPYRQIR